VAVVDISNNNIKFNTDLLKTVLANMIMILI